MPRNETKAKRDVGKRNSSTKSIHQRPRSRSFALLFVVVVVSNLLRPLTPRRITHRNDPPRNGETERERETSIRSARGIKRAPSTFTYDLNCLPGDPPRFHGILALHRIPFSLRGFVCTWLFPRTSSFLSLFFFSSCFSSPMTRRKVEARARRLDAGTRSSYFQLRGTTLVLVPPLFIMNGGLLLLLLLLPPSAFLSANSQKA